MTPKLPPKRPPEHEALGKFLEIFNKESDRGAVLTATAFLEERLRDIIRTFLADVPSSDDLFDSYNAPLGTLSAKIAAAYSLGLIQQNEYTELNIVRRIRNEFAHRWMDVSFSTSRIVDLCNTLPWTGPSWMENESTPKSRFNFLVAILLGDLMWRSQIVSEQKRSIVEFPNRMRGQSK